MITYQPLEWLQDRIRILDQTKLPTEEIYLETSDYLEVATAIKELKVRGAPAIGVAGSYGIALGALRAQSTEPELFKREMADIVRTITATRPTARNLFWAAERMSSVLSRGASADELRESLVREAIAIHQRETEYSLKISEIGSTLICDQSTILTHCNTGPLATTGMGTALGAIIYATQHGTRVKVLVDETRPLMQGARLTTWELQKAGVPFTLISDSMAAYFMSRKQVDAVIVGADSIASNGDTANKIGTYGLAVLAKAHGIPFYVAAPTSTVDASLTDGGEIKIEQRAASEVTHIGGTAIAPPGTSVANPAFDVTPAKYLRAIITERGIINKPFVSGIARVLNGKRSSPARADELRLGKRNNASS